MTYRELLEKASRDFQHNNISRRQYLEMTKPLDEEVRKVGKWLVKDNGNGGKYVECPFCGALAPCTEFADRTVWKYSKFCYDCGNELRGTENE